MNQVPRDVAAERSRNVRERARTKRETVLHKSFPARDQTLSIEESQEFLLITPVLNRGLPMTSFFF